MIIWQCVKTLYPCSSHQNSWDLWMFIPLKMGLIGIDPYPFVFFVCSIFNPMAAIAREEHLPAVAVSEARQRPSPEAGRAGEAALARGEKETPGLKEFVVCN